MFTRIAPYYDLLNTLLSAGLHYRWRRHAADLTALQPGHLALDVATGTGDFALELWRRVGPSGKVVASDFSWGMLRAASAKFLQRGLQGHLRLVGGDALNLPFLSHTFHAATVAFAGRNVVDLHALFREMKRVVRPGGKVVFLELGRPRIPLVSHLFGFYFRRITPLVGRLISRDRIAYSYLPESVYTFPEPEELAQIMREAGLQQVSYRLLSLGIATVHVGTVAASDDRTASPEGFGVAPAS
jgi:demethylmenaquinone methyltransferase/2-methoxy-6-polyprenyl-1,4-benzoquinol methylase